MFLRKEFVTHYEFNIEDKKESDIIELFKDSGLYDSSHEYIITYLYGYNIYEIYRVYQS